MLPQAASIAAVHDLKAFIRIATSSFLRQEVKEAEAKEVGLEDLSVITNHWFQCGDEEAGFPVETQMVHFKISFNDIMEAILPA